ncbi:MAG: hypothetical protein JWQ98_1769 [Chlorobi bacterium]|nr:hypothetical protein [Chlorobiota bacterium]
METFLQDIRFGARTLLKNPGFTAVALLALTLGIGANTAIFSVVNTVLLKSLPYGDPDRLVYLWSTPPHGAAGQFPATALDFREWRQRSRSFTGIAARMQQSFNLTANNNPERLMGEYVSERYFNILDVRPVVGRFFLPTESSDGNDHVVVLSEKLWKRRFGADTSLIGQTIRLENEPYTVVGVAPDDHRGVVEIWAPLVLSHLGPDNGLHRLAVLGRLKPGVTAEQAGGEMAGIAAGLAGEFPVTNREWGTSVVPMHEMVVKNIKTVLLILLGAVGFVLLIACANVANLLLARVSERGREIAIRTALGAGRGRLIRQLLTESILLALIGGALGVLLALWGTDLISHIDSAGIPRASEIRLDGGVLLFALGISVATGIVFGLLPAFHASRSNLTTPLKDGGRLVAGGRGGKRLRGLLVVSEVALALMLLIGAGLLIRSFITLQEIRTGFDQEGVLTMQIAMPATKYSDSSKQGTFFRTAIERISHIPGVESAAATTAIPLTGGTPQFTFTVAGRPIPQPSDAPTTFIHGVSPDYFRTMRIPVLKGRAFNDHDNESSQAVAVIGETMAQRTWPGEDPIGKRMTLGVPVGAPPEAIPYITIVGVVGDVKGQALIADNQMDFYAPITQFPSLTVGLVIRTTGNPADLAGPIRREIVSIDSDIPLYQVRTMEDVVSGSLAGPRLYMLLLGIFAGVALLLAAIGIYGVIAQAVTQRTHEIGIRMALGARRGDIMRMIVGEGFVTALIGVGVGLGLAFVMTRLLGSLLYGVSATDPLTYICVAFVLVIVALAACYIPARRATRVDPMVALKYE